MSFVGQIKSLFRGRTQRRAVKAAAAEIGRRIRARYDAAQTTDENRRHWANADALSAAEANSPGVRRTLRMRSRYERDNNGYCAGMSETLANDTIGNGPRLQMRLPGRTQANREVNKRWINWADEVCLAEKLRTMRAATCIDGESFGELTTNPMLADRVQLDIRLIEAEQVAAPWSRLDQANEVDGIEFDKFGNPVLYHVLKEHPGSRHLVGVGSDSDVIDARSMIQMAHIRRAGQVRGIPETTPALPLYAVLRRYTLATLHAAELAALFSGIMRTTDPGIDAAEDLTEKILMEVERGTIASLPYGWELQQLKAEQPTTTYAQFKVEVLKEIARCLGMPFNVAAGDSSGYNYASGRLDHQGYHRSINVYQRTIERKILLKIMRSWYDEAALIPGYLPPGLPPFVDWQWEWMWDGFEHVDPGKEANAQATKLGSGTTHRQREYSKQGLDMDLEDEAAAASYGLSVEEYRRGLWAKAMGLMGGGPSPDEDEEEPATQEDEAAA